MGQFTKTCGLPLTLVSRTGPNAAVKEPVAGHVCGEFTRVKGWLTKLIVWDVFLAVPLVMPAFAL